MAAFTYITVSSVCFQHLLCLVFQEEVFVHIKFQSQHFFTVLSHVRHVTIHCVVTLVAYNLLFIIFVI